MFTKKAKFVHKRVKNAGVPAGTSGTFQVVPQCGTPHFFTLHYYFLPEKTGTRTRGRLFLWIGMEERI